MILVNTIAEYDIKMAGPSVLWEKDILDEDTYNELISMDKMDRQVALGMMIMDNPEWYNIQTEAYKEYIGRFMKSNRIKDYNVLEFVRDAVWVVGRVPRELKFDSIEFVKKREYTSVFKYKRVYFYVNSVTDVIDIRGLKTDNEEFLEVLKDILIDNEFDVPLYDKLHKVHNNLMDRRDYYGDDLGINIININIIKKLIKELL